MKFSVAFIALVAGLTVDAPVGTPCLLGENPNQVESADEVDFTTARGGYKK
jgi:hypothetical protein